MLSDGRLVWISEHESIERLGAVEFARLVTKRRAEAPSDPAQAVLNVLMENWPRPFHAQARAITTALGVPSPRTEQDDT